MNSAANQRLLDTITELLNAQEFYSAHQKARTSATRLLTSRSGPAITSFDAKAQDAAHLLWEGARRLLEQGQIGSGVDLGKYLVEIWSSRGVTCGDDERSRFPFAGVNLVTFILTFLARVGEGRLSLRSHVTRFIVHLTLTDRGTLRRKTTPH